MRDALMPGALVVVGGHSRGVGKTLLIERFLRARQTDRWIALKISAHRHAPAGSDSPLIEETHDAASATQTGRYLRAGARRAFLVRAPHASLALVAGIIESLLDQGWNVVVESNRIVRYVKPDLVVFVVDPAIDDWKESSAACLSIADMVVSASHLSHLSHPSHPPHLSHPSHPPC